MLEIGNKYGLTRGSLKAPTKRLIRQASGFGCVICGLGIYQYEHVDPEFKDAHEHDPNCMTLLCPRCHHKVTSGMVSKQTVKEAMKNPKCKQQGYSREVFDIGHTSPTLNICGMVFKSAQIPIMIKDKPLIYIEAPENPGEPFGINALFTDSNGKVTLNIINNEWFARSSNWDVDVVGKTITIRENLFKVHLVLESDSPIGLKVNKINMRLFGYRITGNATSVKISSDSGAEILFERMAVSNCKIGLSLG